MRDFHRNFEYKSGGKNRKECQALSYCIADECKCFAPLIKLHHHGCPFVKKSCPVHGKFIYSGKKEGKVNRQQDQCCENSLHPNLKNDKLFHPVKNLLSHNNKLSEKNNFRNYSSKEFNKERFKHRQVQTNSEDIKKVFEQIGNCYFVEKTKSFMADKTNKMKKLKQCFYSPCNSIVQKTQSHTSVGQQTIETISCKVKRTRGSCYINKNLENLEFFTKAGVIHDGIPEPNLYWVSHRNCNLSEDEKSIDNGKIKSDFITVTQKKNNGVLERNIFENETKREENSHCRLKMKSHFAPYVAYPVIRFGNKSKNKVNSFTQTEEEFEFESLKILEMEYSQGQKKTFSDFERPRKEGLEKSNDNLEEASVCEKCDSKSSGSACFIPYILMPTRTDNSKEDNNLPVASQSQMIEVEVEFADLPLDKSTQTSFSSIGETSTSLENDLLSAEEKSFCITQEENENIKLKESIEIVNHTGSSEATVLKFTSEVMKKLQPFEAPEIKDVGTQTEDYNYKFTGYGNGFMNEITNGFIHPLESNSSNLSETSGEELEKVNYSFKDKSSVEKSKRTGHQVKNHSAKEALDEASEDHKIKNLVEKQKGQILKQGDVPSFPQNDSHTNGWFGTEDKPIPVTVGKSKILEDVLPEKVNISQREGPIYSHKSIQTSPFDFPFSELISDAKSYTDKEVQTKRSFGDLEFLDLTCNNSSNITFIIKSLVSHEAEQAIKRMTEEQSVKPTSNDIIFEKKEFECISEIPLLDPGDDLKSSKIDSKKEVNISNLRPVKSSHGSKHTGEVTIPPESKENKKVSPIEDVKLAEKIPVEQEPNDSSFSDLTELIKLINSRFDKMETGQKKTVDCGTVTDKFEETRFPLKKSGIQVVHVAVQTTFQVIREKTLSPAIENRTQVGEKKNVSNFMWKVCAEEKKTLVNISKSTDNFQGRDYSVGREVVHAHNTDKKLIECKTGKEDNKIKSVKSPSTAPRYIVKSQPPIRLNTFEKNKVCLEKAVSSKNFSLKTPTSCYENYTYAQSKPTPMTPANKNFNCSIPVKSVVLPNKIPTPYSTYRVNPVTNQTQVNTPKPRPTNAQVKLKPTKNNLSTQLSRNLETKVTERPANECYCSTMLSINSKATDYYSLMPVTYRPLASNRPTTSADGKNNSNTKHITYSVTATPNWPKQLMQSLQEEVIPNSKNDLSFPFSNASGKSPIRQKRSRDVGKDSHENTSGIKKIKHDKFEDIKVFDIGQEEKRSIDCFIFGLSEPGICDSNNRFTVKNTMRHFEKTKNSSLTKSSGFVWVPSFSEPQFLTPKDDSICGSDKVTKSEETLRERSYRQNNVNNRAAWFDTNTFCNLFATETLQHKSTGTLDCFDVDKQSPKLFKCSFCKSLTYLKRDGNKIFEDNESQLMGFKTFLEGRRIENEFTSVERKKSSVFAHPCIQSTSFSNSNTEISQIPCTHLNDNTSNEPFFGECSQESERVCSMGTYSTYPKKFSFKKFVENAGNISDEVGECSENFIPQGGHALSFESFSFRKLTGLHNTEVAPTSQSFLSFQTGKKMFSKDRALKKSKNLRN